MVLVLFCSEAIKNNHRQNIFERSFNLSFYKGGCGLRFLFWQFPTPPRCDKVASWTSGEVQVMRFVFRCFVFFLVSPPHTPTFKHRCRCVCNLRNLFVSGLLCLPPSPTNKFWALMNSCYMCIYIYIYIYIYIHIYMYMYV